MINYAKENIKFCGCPGCAYAKGEFSLPCGIAYQKISKTVESYMLCGFQVNILVPHTRMLC